MARGPYSRRQQRFIFWKARQGAAWAKEKIAEAPTMKVQPKGASQPKPDPRYDAEKRALSGGRRARRRRL